MKKKIRIILGIGFLICCIFLLITIPYSKKGVIFIGFLLILGLTNFQKNLFVQYIAFLLVFLLALQTLIGHIIVDNDYVTLTPNMKVNNLVIGDALPGVEGMVYVQTDQKGFRVTKPINYGETAPYRIFLIGGSTIEQIYIDDLQTSSYLLQCKLEELLKFPVEVINTGISGALARNHLSTLSKIEKYHPNLVIIMMGANDWNRQIKDNFRKPNSFVNNIRSKYAFNLSPAYKLVTHIFEYLNSTPANLNIFQVDHGEYYSRQNNSLARAIRYDYRPQNISDEFSLFTREIFKKCQMGKYKTLVVAQINSYKDNAADELKKYYWCTPPNEKYTLEFSNMVYFSDLYNNFLEKEARRYGLVFYKIDNLQPTTENFYDDMHLNKRGAAIFADDIYQCIIKNDLLPNKE